MLSNDKVWPLLAKGFAAVRLDWEQGNHYRDRFGFVLGTGDQLLLKPDGSLIAPAGGKRVYGRHGEDTTPDVLARATRESGSAGEITQLRIEWFLWSTGPSAKRRGGFFPPRIDAIAQFARLPIAEIHGPIPEALHDPAFLRRHVRQFLWKRGDEEGESRLVLRRARDGLPAHLDTGLEELRGEALVSEALGVALDEAWLRYMKDRPLTARGYLENEHGRWMRGVSAQMLGEDESIRRLARDGKLRPPGR